MNYGRSVITPDLHQAMQPYSNCGWIEVITGPMRSGKRSELTRRIRCARNAGQQVAFFCAIAPETEPQIPLAVEEPPVLIRSSREVADALPAGIEVVAVDEAQFLDTGLARVAADLTAHGIRVIVSGLDTDFRGHTFGVVGDLMAQAEIVDKLRAICLHCGSPATRTQRLLDGRPVGAGAPTVAVGAEVGYEPRCRACHMVPQGD